MAAEYPRVLKAVIEGGYISKQVFNVDETGLNWKWMPERTYVSQEEKLTSGFKAANDRVTLLGGNASGDIQFKPILVYHSVNPRALKGHSKQHLPAL